ncbi:MAG TPA: class I SAM-dependent methyltransferase [Chloroflexi bacterium]|nr:class I SAM-dependent methyltransferase [Chloroflexota bacterium]
MPGHTQGWEPLWAGVDALSEYWRTPAPRVVDWAERLKAAGGRRILDLGCGLGRHTVALVGLGFSVFAADVSPSGLAACAAWLAREGSEASLLRHDMETLPSRDGVFDGLLAYNVVYHTTVTGMRHVLTETRRVLCPGGWLYATIVSREERKIAGYRADVAAGRCLEIEPYTFVYPRNAPTDKHLPHHYCDEVELRALLTAAGFEIAALCLVRVEYAGGDGRVQTGAHYHVQAHRG